MGSTTIWNGRDTAGVLSNRHGTGQPSKTPAVDDRKTVESFNKTSVGDITNNQDAKRSSAVRLRRPDSHRDELKGSGTT